MNRGLWYLFSREVKVPSLVLGGFILLGFAFSWVLAAYGIFGCLIFIYFRLKDRVQKIYYFFLFLSEELIERKKLELTNEEEILFLYNPCGYLLKRYCVEKEEASDPRYAQYFKEESLPELFRKLMGMNQEVFDTVISIIFLYEMFLPLILGSLMVVIFKGAGLVIGMIFTCISYWYLYIPHYQCTTSGHGIGAAIFIFVGNEFLNELAKENKNFVDEVVRADYNPQGKSWKWYLGIWEQPKTDSISSIPVTYRFTSTLERLEEMSKAGISNALTTAFQNNELTAKQIYDQIDEKIEAANLTAQELWDLWAEYYFEGYEPLKKIE